MAANPVEITSSLLRLEAQTTNGRAIMKCTGKLVSETTPLLKAKVKELIPSCRSIVLDLSDLRYMDSSGLGTLVSLYVSARSSHCELKLMNLGERVKELLRLTQLSNVFQGYGEYL